jgi:HD-GYP domain-containing protein (c-di-GMP phosphodiesterase class II)
VTETGDDSGLRLAELVAAFSLAMDLGLGQPMEHVLRAWLIAARLGDQMGIAREQRGALYYIAMLAWVGCVAETPEVATLFGDDIAYRHDTYSIDRTGLPMLGFMLRHAGAGRPFPQRVRAAADLLASGGSAVERAIQSHCLVTASMADRLGLGTEVRDPLKQFFTRWDGKGVPTGVGGDAIALPIRLFQLADAIEVTHRSDGTAAAMTVARDRRGTQFDPAVVDAFSTAADDVLGQGLSEADWYVLIEQEPALQQRLSEHDLDAALEAIADFTDLRSPSRAGHSRGVADLAARAAEHAALPPTAIVAVWRAALLHDIGLHGVPASILDKPGPLSRSEWERMRMHAYYTERMLARPPILARLGAIASVTNERSDGSGYHRGLSGSAIPAAGRLLAAACAYRAMTEPRPHRPAMTAKAAAAELTREIRAGRFDADAANSVLAAAGQAPGKRWSGPAGLTPREVEVLALIARGASNRQVASALGISTKTAGTHIERIYSKIGASTRSTATLFAMQHGLLDTLAPSDL